MEVYVDEEAFRQVADQVVAQGVADTQQRLDAVFEQHHGEPVEQIQNVLDAELGQASIQWDEAQVKQFAAYIAAGTRVQLNAD
ncbi:hypothetical protein [Arsenicicoccus dermatophilus]|uniref:hypothetical protein n=1 Tax=Arsenicicoccus dermatophilus TaxID=1076331 RepID=UPI001F4D2555|nr:hypothetical protein [Arsenicicoccus dermatophilus]MCH8614459.1 hypothetical protein [Arsenicicoccus dermatophilus]